MGNPIKRLEFKDGISSISKAENIDNVDHSWAIGAMLKDASDIEVDNSLFFCHVPLVIINFLVVYLTNRKKYSMYVSKKEYF